MNGYIDVVHPVVVGTSSIAAEESNVMPPSTFGKMISHAHAAVTHISDLATGSICCIFCSHMPVMFRTPTRKALAISSFKVLNKKIATCFWPYHSLTQHLPSYFEYCKSTFLEQIPKCLKIKCIDICKI